jgi:hypothetical protein
VSLRLGIIHVVTVGLGGCRADRDSNCIPSAYQNCGSVPTALPRWRISVDNPLLARNDFDRDDAKATHSRSRLPRLNRQRLLSLLLTKCPRTTRAHRSRADRRSGTRPLRAAYGYPTPFPNLRRTIKKLRRRLSPSPTPLSVRCKFSLFRTSTYLPYTFLSAGFQATWAQAMGQWPHNGGGMQGWAKRLGATLADTESRRFIQRFALSMILHQDPRYFPSHKRSLISRAWYATTRVGVTRSDRGDNTFNSSEFLGALFTSSLQNAYYPRHDRNVGETMNRFGGALSSDAIGDLLREFTPDMKRLFRKHAPKKILRRQAIAEAATQTLETLRIHVGPTLPEIDLNPAGRPRVEVLNVVVTAIPLNLERRIYELPRSLSATLRPNTSGRYTIDARSSRRAARVDRRRPSCAPQ